MGSEFSKKALENYRKSGKALRCKLCTDEIAKAEQAEAAAKTTKVPASSSEGGVGETTARCRACGKELSVDLFNKNQLRKGDDKRRCRDCVRLAEEEEKKKIEDTKAGKIAAAEAQLLSARTPAEQLKATAELSALQAETVTGLKPVVLGGVKGRPSKRR